MTAYYKEDSWKIIETEFNKEKHQASESIFSIGNGIMGQRANFEEEYSGDSLQGNYIAGVFFPDKTRVGWWKNGYPDYFAKVINAPSWNQIKLKVAGVSIDLGLLKVQSFYRELDMKKGLLSRKAEVQIADSKFVKIESRRFVSMDMKEIGAIEYIVEPVNFSADIELELPVDSAVVNEDANYGESFWNVLSVDNDDEQIIITSQTKENSFGTPRFAVSTGMMYEIFVGNKAVDIKAEKSDSEKKASHILNLSVDNGETLKIYKYGCTCSSLFYETEELVEKNKEILIIAKEKGFDRLLEKHQSVWEQKWETGDIEIEGDVSAQQGIRFNIFHLLQTYTGDDPRFNIGPKGFTGEKYGGVTYWDTEAFCFPFFLSTCDPSIARNLLLYRHKQLDRAIANAEKLGFKNGAALYPMVTITGDECHNEWEITFEEIHRNGAIAHAVFEYVEQTGDEQYLIDYGLEVLIGISRFWAQRSSFSEEKQKFVILGVTGPNEYENNVNNNWFTNYYAHWCMKYTAGRIDKYKQKASAETATLMKKLDLTDSEVEDWRKKASNMYLGYDEKRNVFIQQDGFFDKEIIPADKLPVEQRPINQYWSWDRILRSCYIKQADVVQGLYVFEDSFSKETIESNFLFYEPITVHESSLSPCIHSVVASSVGFYDKAYELYLRTARLDLDDYNAEAHEGLHITSMAGSWLAIIKGFAGMRIVNRILSFAPVCPKQWNGYSFKILYNGAQLAVEVKNNITISHLQGNDVKFMVYEKEYTIGNKSKVTMALQ